MTEVFLIFSRRARMKESKAAFEAQYAGRGAAGIVPRLDEVLQSVRNILCLIWIADSYKIKPVSVDLLLRKGRNLIAMSTTQVKLVLI